MKIILLGKPGSGKGTQAELLSKRLKAPVLTMGAALRKLEKQRTKLGRLVKSYIDKGNFVPDRISIGIAKKELSRKKSYILDGFPRNLKQAEELGKFAAIDKVIYIDVDDRILVRRLSSRRECTRCKEIYNLLTRPPRKDMKCDKCGSKLYQRPDDRPSVIRKRLRVFNKMTRPLIAYYKKKDLLRRINGDAPIRQIFKSILKSISLK